MHHDAITGQLRIKVLRSGEQGCDDCEAEVGHDVRALSGVVKVLSRDFTGPRLLRGVLVYLDQKRIMILVRVKLGLSFKVDCCNDNPV